MIIYRIAGESLADRNFPESRVKLVFAIHTFMITEGVARTILWCMAAMAWACPHCK